MVKLTIYKVGSEDVRYVAERFEFSDTFMGERNVTFTAKSHEPIDWQIGDYLTYRGQTYHLNSIPTCVQTGGIDDSGDSFSYDNVKFDDNQGDLQNCMVLDVTPTTGDYIASRGTNYTGSSVFTLYCAETTVSMQNTLGQWVDVTLSPVAYLGGVIQANLNRLYPSAGWRVDVNPALSGLEDKVISLNKWYVPQALAEIHNQWDVDYIVIGHTIKIGYTLNNVTGEDDVAFVFGYGRGYSQHGDDGKSLFSIKRISDSSQKIVTRLRAIGSTRNMPYRYYNKKYSLPQSMFVNNLQLPDTFEIPSVKEAHNIERDNTYGTDGDGHPLMRHVLGDTNDAYVDKLDDAASCPEGIREGAGFWDGSDSELEEIYPTIQSGTYLDLRGALIPDIDGGTGSTAYPNYGDYERIDEILGVDEQTTNIGDGIVAEADASGQQEQAFNVGTDTITEQSAYAEFYGQERTMFTTLENSQGKYMMSASENHVNFHVKFSSQSATSAYIGYIVKIYQDPTDGSPSTLVGSYRNVVLADNNTYVSLRMPDLPDVRDDMKINGNTQVGEISLTKKSRARAVVQPYMSVGGTMSGMTSVSYYIDSDDASVQPRYVWSPVDATDLFANQPFYIYIKDIGIDMTTLQTTGDDATIHFNTGQCGGMEFKFNPNDVEQITVNGKKGWKLLITERFIDDNLHIYYPNAYNKIQAGDRYVLLNIEFPEVYIKIAELRLLDAATKYLADNCEPKYTYEPEISDIYLQQNLDKWREIGHEELSVYWNLYAGYKFSMRGIPSNRDEVLPIIDNITIKSVTIREGEAEIPHAEIVLNNEVDQSTIQKLTVSVDRIYNSFFGSGGNGGGSGASYSTLLNLLRSEGGKLFLSKTRADSANGLIDFLAGLHSDNAATFGEWVQDVAGAGIYHDNGGWHIEADYLHARKKLVAKELQIEEVTHVGGQQLLSAAEMVCDYVVEHDTFYRCYFLKVGENGRVIHNKWKAGDQARMQSFNVDEWETEQLGNRYYWRLVIGTSKDTQEDIADYNQDFSIDFFRGVYLPDNVNIADYHFIDLSKSDCDTDSDVPMAGDKIIQLGYRYDDDPSRQNAIMLAGAGTASPYIDEYVGINSYTLEGKCMTRIKPNENMFTGKVHIEGGSTIDGKDLEQFIADLEDSDMNIQNLNTGNENLLRNTGFTGDYEYEDVEEGTEMNPETQNYSAPLKYWNYLDATVRADINSASGFSAQIGDGYIQQETTKELNAGDDYNVSFRASGTFLSVSVGTFSKQIVLTNALKRYTLRFTNTTNGKQTFSVIGTNARIMEIQLSCGNVANTDWIPSPLDNTSAIAYFQNLAYLANAINNASTEILGGLILSQMIRVGNYRNRKMVQETGGMSGIYVSNNSPFLWGGGTMEDAIYTVLKYADNPEYQPTEEELSKMAKFVVTHGGRAILNDIVLRGYIYALGGYFKGEVHAEGGVFKSVTSPNGNFSIDESGNFECTDARIRGQLYTPMFIVNESNWAHSIILQPENNNNILNLGYTGLNVQIDYTPYEINILLPLDNAALNGAQIYIINNSQNTINIATRHVMVGGLLALAPSKMIVLYCYKDGNYYEWINV